MICIACLCDQPLTAFHKNPHNADGYNHTCKTCCQAYHRAYLERPKVAPLSGLMACTGCMIEKSLTEFHKARGTTTGYALRCKACCAAYQKQWRIENANKVRENVTLPNVLVCLHCNTEKSLEEFSLNKTKKSGRSDWCKVCDKQYNKEYRTNNSEQIFLQRRQYRDNLPQEEKDRLADYLSLWKYMHPEEIAEIQQRRRARKANAPINDLTSEQWKTILIAFHHCCAYCGKSEKTLGKSLEQDHITAIAKGGSHTMSNVVPACRSCNARKSSGNVPKPIQPLLL